MDEVNVQKPLDPSWRMVPPPHALDVASSANASQDWANEFMLEDQRSHSPFTGATRSLPVQNSHVTPHSSM